MGDGRATRWKRNIFVGIHLKNALYRPRYISYRVYRAVIWQIHVRTAIPAKIVNACS